MSSTFIYQVYTVEMGRKYKPRPSQPNAHDRNGWKLFKVIRTKSFRLEIEHEASGRKFETSLLKDNLPTLSSAIWIKLIDRGVELSFFDIERFVIINIPLSLFEARKFATMNEWITFDMWFSVL